MRGAFHGDSRIKAAALVRLTARVEAGTLAAEIAQFRADSASWSGELAQSSELMDLPIAVGIPAGLGLAIDQVLRLLASKQEERDSAAVRLLTVIRPGAELDSVAANMIPFLLDDPVLVEWRELPLVVELCALQQRSAAGETAPRIEWSMLRKRAADAIAESGGDAIKRELLQVVEAAAWPMAASRSGLGDVIWTYTRLTSSLASRDSGWVTGEDDARFEHTMRAIAEANVSEDTAAERPDFMAILRQRDPELASRYCQMGDAWSLNQTRIGSRIIERFVEVLSAT